MTTVSEEVQADAELRNALADRFVIAIHLVEDGHPEAARLLLRSPLPAHLAEPGGVEAVGELLGTSDREWAARMLVRARLFFGQEPLDNPPAGGIM